MPHAYAARERCNNACLLVFSLRFSTKYRVVLCNRLLLFAHASCLIQRRYRKLFFFSGRGRTLSDGGDRPIVVEVCPIPQQTRGSGGAS